MESSRRLMRTPAPPRTKLDRQIASAKMKMCQGCGQTARMGELYCSACQEKQYEEARSRDEQIAAIDQRIQLILRTVLKRLENASKHTLYVTGMANEITRIEIELKAGTFKCLDDE